MKSLFLTFVITCLPASVFAESGSKASVVKTKRKVTRKTQEVNFDVADIDGVARTPEGAFMLQKRGIKFMPLYKVEKQFDREIRESVEFLR